MPRIRRRYVRRAAAVLAVAALALGITLFVHEYQLGDGEPTAGGPYGSAALPSPGTTPRPSSHPAGAATVVGARATPTALTLHGVTITPAVPGGIVFGKLPTHRVVLAVRSADRVPRIGYIAPASVDSTSGDLKNQGGHWSVTLRIVGKPYYAALFIQAGPHGAVTCSITIDGKRATSQTTAGPYGGKVCVG